ncbi:hypothetical protein D3C81_1639450 [compost metagenome]
MLLPSPGREEVTTRIRCGPLMPDSTRAVRMVRIDSLKLLSSSLLNRWAIWLRCRFFISGRMPSTGRLSLFSTSSMLLKVLLRICSSRVIPVLPSSARMPARPTIRPRIGLIGLRGTMAGSTTLALALSRSAVAVASFRRVMKVSYRVRLASTSRWSSRISNSLREIF